MKLLMFSFMYKPFTGLKSLEFLEHLGQSCDRSPSRCTKSYNLFIYSWVVQARDIRQKDKSEIGH